MDRECGEAPAVPVHSRPGEREQLQSLGAKLYNTQRQYVHSVRNDAQDVARVLLIGAGHRYQALVGGMRDEFGAQCAIVSTFAEAQDRISALSSVEVVVMCCDEACATACERINALRQRAGRPLPIVLLVSDLSFDALKKIARAGPVDALPETVDHAGLVASVQCALEWFAPAEQFVENENSVLAMLAGIEARLNDLTGASPAAFDDGRPVLRRRADRAHMVLHEAGVDCDMIRSVMQFRSAQREIFGASLIDDTAWVMLLDLLMMYLERKKLAVTSLYIGSGAPVATALRRLNQLLDKELAVKVPDPSDRRRTLVEITPKGVEGVCAMLNHMKAAFSEKVDN